MNSSRSCLSFEFEIRHKVSTYMVLMTVQLQQFQLLLNKYYRASSEHGHAGPAKFAQEVRVCHELQVYQGRDELNTCFWIGALYGDEKGLRNTRRGFGVRNWGLMGLGCPSIVQGSWCWEVGLVLRASDGNGKG